MARNYHRYSLVKQFLRTLILLLVRLLGAPGARVAAQHARKPLPTAPRILLIRPDHLGDLVLTTPVLHALKTQAPNIHTTMMVGPWSSEVVARHPDIDQLITFPFPGFQRTRQKPWTPYILLLSAAQQLRHNKYDLVINLRPDFWWGAALTYLARIPPLAEPYTPERYPLQFTPTPEEHAWVAERLSKEGIDAETPVIVIHPGTAAAVKLWRPEAWSQCANALTGLHPRYAGDHKGTLSGGQVSYPYGTLTQSAPARIILTGSKNERPLMEEIARGITAPVVLITDATLGQLTALLGRAQLVLGVDSGPPHLATSQGTPTVRIFGPTDPRLAGPWGPPEQHLVIASTQRCPGCPTIPCGRIDFRPEELPAHPCTRLVPEQHVMVAIHKLLKGAAKP